MKSLQSNSKIGALLVGFVLFLMIAIDVILIVFLTLGYTQGELLINQIWQIALIIMISLFILASSIALIRRLRRMAELERNIRANNQ